MLILISLPATDFTSSFELGMSSWTFIAVKLSDGPPALTHCLHSLGRFAFHAVGAVRRGGPARTEAKYLDGAAFGKKKRGGPLMISYQPRKLLLNEVFALTECQRNQCLASHLIPSYRSFRGRVCLDFQCTLPAWKVPFAFCPPDCRLKFNCKK